MRRSDAAEQQAEVQRHPVGSAANLAHAGFRGVSFLHPAFPTPPYCGRAGGALSCSPGPCPVSLSPAEGSGTGRWEQGLHSLDFVDLRAEVKYVHGAFQGVSGLVGRLFPGEPEDTEEGAAL